MLQVSGVGPKAALGILSEMSVRALCHAIAQRDTTGLEQVSGIGKRTAEKILLELQTKQERLLALAAECGDHEKVSRAEPLLPNQLNLMAPDVQTDLKSALLNLGLNEKDWKFALQSAKRVYRQRFR